MNNLVRAIIIAVSLGLLVFIIYNKIYPAGFDRLLVPGSEEFQRVNGAGSQMYVMEQGFNYTALIISALITAICFASLYKKSKN